MYVVLFLCVVVFFIHGLLNMGVTPSNDEFDLSGRGELETLVPGGSSILGQMIPATAVITPNFWGVTPTAAEAPPGEIKEINTSTNTVVPTMTFTPSPTMTITSTYDWTQPTFTLTPTAYYHLWDVVPGGMQYIWPEYRDSRVYGKDVIQVTVVHYVVPVTATPMP